MDLCPWLGTDQDHETRYLEPARAHVCYAQERPADVELDYQARFCLTDKHRTCRFYREPPPPPAPLTPGKVEDEFGPLPGDFPTLWVIIGIVALLAAVVVVYYYGSALWTPQPTVTPTTATNPHPSPTPGATATSTASPAPTFEFTAPTATPTPYPGGAIYSLSPQARTTGWVASNEPRSNHLGDSHLYAGVCDDIIYHGLFQFDLSPVPRGATIHAAIVEITGLDDRRLGDSGVWEVRVLAREIDEGWNRHTFRDVHDASVQWTLFPALSVDDLAVGKTNVFALSREQIRDLEQRLLDEHYTVSLRLDGPLAGENSVFAWDAGHGPATRGYRPRLLLNVGAPPQPPLPTSTPIPTATPE